MSYRAKEFNRLNEEFNDSAKQILDENEKSVKALENVLDCYNSLIVYSEIDYETKKRATREHIESTLGVNRITVQRCFEKLNLPIVLPGKLLSTIHYVLDSGAHSKPETKADANLSQTNPIIWSTLETETSKMTQTIDNFMKYTQSILNYKFKGDPLELNGFISDATLLMSMATADETKKFCFEYIKNSVRGRAEEYVPENCTTLTDLISALKSKIKPETSDVVEGKILSLRLQKGDFTKFAQEAEKLSEAFRRALVVEGITKNKAEEMTVTKMVELCRKTAKIEIVKSVLESTKFDTPAEVIAKFITQTDKARREYKEANPTNSKNQGGNNTNFNKKKGNKNRNDNKNENRSDNRFGNRGGNRNKNQNQQRSRNRNNDNRSTRSNEQTIRLIASTPQNTVEQPLQPQEQFFRIEN